MDKSCEYLKNSGSRLSMRSAASLIYLAFAFVFFTFGIQKLLPGSSPVGPGVRSFLTSLGFNVTMMWPIYFIGIYEMILGILFYFRRLRLATVLFVPHQITGFLALLFIPSIAFTDPWLAIGGLSIPYAYDWFAAFVLKNVVFVAAFVALVVIELDRYDTPTPSLSTAYTIIGGFMVLAFFLSVVHGLQNPLGSHLHDDPSALGDEVTFPEFTEKTENYNLDYQVDAPHQRIVSFGGGVYSSDINRNGYPDILLLGGTPQLFINEQGEEFNRSESFPEYGFRNILAAHFVDLDRNGYEDLILLPSEGPPIILRNTEGSFVHEEEIDGVELSNPAGAVSADFDRNGCPDIMIYQTSQSSPNEGGYNHLIRNEDCGFDLDYEGKLEHPDMGAAVTQAASAYDITGNGYPDIHTGNDFSHDVLHVNREGVFDSQVMEDYTNRNGMASELADISGNHLPDILVTNVDQNNLLVNKGDGKFEDRAGDYGIKRGNWGWAMVAEDLTNDGDTEIFHSNSNVFAPSDPPLWKKSSEEQYSRIHGHDIGGVSGSGVIAIDIQNNGKLDLVKAPRHISESVRGYRGLDSFEQYNSVKIYENTADRNNFLRVRPETESGSPLLGTKVTIEYGGESRTNFLDSGSDYFSQSPSALHFGVGDAEKIDRLEITWPDGEKTVLQDREANKYYSVTPNKAVDGDYITSEYNITVPQNPKKDDYLEEGLEDGRDIEIRDRETVSRLELSQDTGIEGDTEDLKSLVVSLPELEEAEEGSIEYQIDGERYTGIDWEDGRYLEEYDERVFRIPLGEEVQFGEEHVLNQIYWVEPDREDVELLNLETNISPDTVFNFEVTSHEFLDVFGFQIDQNGTGLRFDTKTVAPVELESSSWKIEQTDGDMDWELSGVLLEPGSEVTATEEDLYIHEDEFGITGENSIRATPESLKSVMNIHYNLEELQRYSDSASSTDELREDDIITEPRNRAKYIEVEVEDGREVQIDIWDDDQNTVKTVTQKEMNVDGNSVYNEIDLEGLLDDAEYIMIRLFDSDNKSVLVGSHLIEDFHIRI